MATESLAEVRGTPQRELPETRPRMVKADLRIAEAERLRVCIGRAIDRARQLRGWTLDELAGQLPPPAGSEVRDPRQVARWISGAERPQFDVLLAVTSFRRPLFLAWCEVFGEGVEIETVVKVRSA